MNRIVQVTIGVATVAILSTGIFLVGHGKINPIAGVHGRSGPPAPIENNLSLSLSNLQAGTLGLALASLIQAKDLPLLHGDAQRFQQDCQEWLVAYTTESHTAMLKMMETTDIAPAPSWSTPEGATDSWSRNLALLEVIAFDSVPPVITVHHSQQTDTQRYRGRVMRCGRRDDARPFLQNYPGQELEVLFSGFVLNTDSNQPVPMQVAFTFAWDQKKSRWLVTGTCLFDFPNSMSEAYALLL